MIWVIQPKAGVIAMILPDILANVLALTLWELLSTAEISADNSKPFSRVHIIYTISNPMEILTTLLFD